MKEVKARALYVFLYARGKTRRDNERIPTRTHLQKEIFALQQTYGDIFEGESYPFTAGLYGPFSKALANDLEELVRMKHVSPEHIELLPAGFSVAAQLWRSLDESKRVHIIRIKEQYNWKSYSEVIDTVYNKWPKFTINSALKDEVIDDYIQKTLREHDVSEEEILRAVSLYKKVSVKD